MTNAKASSTAALVIDVQSAEGRNKDDLESYFTALGDTLTRLRAQNIPIAWVTIQEGNNGLHLPRSSASTPRDFKDLEDLGFNGVQLDKKNHAFFRAFMKDHGPRMNEAVCCKSFESALIEPGDVDGNPAYQKELEGQQGDKPFDSHFNGGPTLVDYLKAKGVKNTLLMGAVSSHCIAQTATSAFLKGLNPKILIDRVLSWKGVEPETAADTQKTFLMWRGKSDDVSWNKYHKDKVQESLKSIAGQPHRKEAVGAETGIQFSTADAAIPTSTLQRAPTSGLQQKR